MSDKVMFMLMLLVAISYGRPYSSSSSGCYGSYCYADSYTYARSSCSYIGSMRMFCSSSSLEPPGQNGTDTIPANNTDSNPTNYTGTIFTTTTLIPSSKALDEDTQQRN